MQSRNGLKQHAGAINIETDVRDVTSTKDSRNKQSNSVSTNNMIMLRILNAQNKQIIRTLISQF